MIVRSFLQWFENAPVHERIEAAQVMAQSYLSDQLGADSQQDAEAAITLILDDPCVAVRRALAFELAGAPRAPRHVIIALAHDTSEVAALVLARSQLLREADLVDCAAVGDVLSQTAIAMRFQLPVTVSAALAEVGAAEALVALVNNTSADISPVSFARMLDRCPEHAPLRQAMHDRDDLPMAVRQALVASVSQQLLKFVGDTGWMAPQRAQRMISETRDCATVALAARTDDLDMFVDFLRNTAQLTPSLLLRSLLSGETALFGAALVSLTGVDQRRVAGIMKSRNETAFFALYLKAGLSKPHFPAFSAALSAIRDSGDRLLEGVEPRLQRFIVQRALGACLEGNEDQMRNLIGLLRRFDAEAARLDARIATGMILNSQTPMMLEDAHEAATEARDVLQTEAPLTQDNEPFERMLTIDFSQLEAEMILEGEQVAEQLPPSEALLSDEVPAEIPAHIEDAVVCAPEVSSPPPAALHVIEDRTKLLDERFFANWKLRKRAA